MRWSSTAALGLGCALALAAAPSAAADWPMFGGDAAHRGRAADDRLSLRTVGTLHRRWRTQLDATADNAPIVVGNDVFLTDRGGTTYALDSRDGRIRWRFRAAGPKLTTTSPAYDAPTAALYAAGADGAVHRLDPRTGAERRDAGFPVALTLAPQTEKVASPLTLADGELYAQTSGYIGDAPPYVGHVVAIRLRDGERHVFNVLCSARRTLIAPQRCASQRAGLWSRAGVVVDPDPAMHGRVYVATGNGPFSSERGDYGDSLLALRAADLALDASWTPPDADALEAADRDLGSSAPALLPHRDGTPLLAVQGGKDSRLRLIDRQRMRVLQTLDLENELFAAPAVWRAPDGTIWVYIALVDGVHAFRLPATGPARLAPAWYATPPAPSGDASPALGDGIVVIPTNAGLVALDALTGKPLWRGPLGGTHWQSPAIAGGSVYCADEDGTLSAFGP